MSWLWWLLLPGCLAWLGMAVAGALTARRVPKLARLSPARPRRWPSLAVIVPCRDEGAHVEAAARTLLALEYPHLRVVLVDDRSRDHTGAIMDRLAAEDPRVTVVHVTELPPGWLGKNHALARGAEAADAEWLLFTDGDVHLHPECLRRAVAHALAEGADQLALLPDVWTARAPLLDLCLAAFGRYFMVGQKLWAVSDPDSAASVGVGAFNLVRRAALDDAGGVAAFPLDVADDLALGRVLKRAGAHCVVAGGNGLVGLGWYDSFASMARGLEKNTFAPLEFKLTRLALLVGCLLVVELSPWAALAALGDNSAVFAAGALAIACAVAMDLGGAVWAKRPRWTCLFVPVGGLLMAGVFLRAGVIGWRRGGLVWRDTFYPRDEIVGRQVVTWP